MRNSAPPTCPLLLYLAQQALRVILAVHSSPNPGRDSFVGDSACAATAAMAAFLSSPTGPGRDDYSHLLASPAQQPWAMFASPAPVVQEGRLSFDVLTSPGGVPGDAVFKGLLRGAGRRACVGGCRPLLACIHLLLIAAAHKPPPWLPAGRSASHLELFTMPGQDCANLADAAPAPAPAAGPQQPQQELVAVLTQRVVAKTVEAKQQEVGNLVAGVAAKYGLAADYGKAEETIKAVWAEQASVAGHPGAPGRGWMRRCLACYGDCSIGQTNAAAASQRLCWPQGG